MRLAAPLRWIIVLALVIAALVTAPALLAVDPYKHPATGISLPERMAGMVRGEIRLMATSGADGVIAQYHDEEAVATIYIRRMEIHEKTTAEGVVADSLAAVRELERRGMYAKVERLKGDEEPVNSPWARAAFTASVEAKGPVTSIIYATIKDGHVIKVRFTSSDPKSEVVAKFMDQFRTLVGNKIARE